jgi:hypothetical protein
MMTNEEIEKTMRFILEQQAQFVVDIQKLQESQAQTEQIVNRLAAVTVKGFEETNTKINALIDSHTRLLDSHLRLTESQVKTDETLRNLIAVVDRYFTEEHDGNS